MRPLRLVLIGIGPFVEKAEIDFARLGEKSLFLIHGPTGAGKSFLFDAMTYALYGVGCSSRGTRLKSDHIGVGIKPIIQFRFGLGDHTYEVERTLAYQRPARRGDKVVEEDEQAELREILPAGETHTLATRKQAVNSRCGELLGLDHEQFAQVILLPQGEFRKLLLAEVTDREALLARLFDSSFFKELEQQLHEHRQHLEQDAQDKLVKADTMAEQLRSLIPPAVQPPAEERITLACLQRGVAHLQGELPQLQEASKQASAAVLAANNELNAVRQLKGLFDQSVKLETEARSLATEKQQIIDPLMAAKQADAEAQKLKPLVDENERLEREARSLNRELADLQRKLEAAAGHVTTAEKAAQKVGVLETHKSALTARVAAVQPLSAVCSQMDTLAAELTEQDAKFKRATGELQDAQTKLQTHKSAINTKKKTLETERAAATDLAKLQAESADAEQYAERLKELEELKAVISEQQGELKAFEAEREKAEAALTNLAQRRERGLAAELAGALETGEPCPVCGSTKHPQPAKRAKDAASKEDVAEAEGDRKRAVKACDKARSDHDKTTAKQESLHKDLKKLLKKRPNWDGMTPKAAARLSKTLSEAVEQERERATRIRTLDREFRKLDNDLPAMEKKCSTPEEAVQDWRQKVTGTRTNLNLQTKRWTESLTEEERRQLPPAKTLEERLCTWIRNMEQERDGIPLRIRQLQEAVKNAREAREGVAGQIKEKRAVIEQNQTTYRARRTELDATLAKSRFKEAAAVKSALWDDSQRQRAEQAFENFSSRLNTNKTRRDDLAGQLMGKQQPDVPASERIAKEKETAQTTAAKAFHNAEQTLAQLRLGQKGIENLQREAERLAAELRLLGKLDDQVRGQGEPKISLERFYLAQRLEEVLIQATRRLAVLSRGRFTLRRETAVRHAASQAGLDLNVFDNWTGVERPASTLSGGQMFLASLSLALGVADVVQARAGGVNLEALFVDEGFGSLDEETLDLALQTLNELREGKMVGVISHVAEMKRQIANRIEIVAGPGGSYARLVTA